ncbi:MAG: endonuclease [Clostridia bacterium]|nr:endonuclease [Clostridia bacterium]
MKKKLAAISLVAVLGLCAFAPVVAAQAPATIASAATTATGYTKASDVKYVKDGKYVANWGARDEDCVFLTSYATNYYTGSYTYDTLSKNAGSTSISSVPNSALYKALHSMVSTKQTYTTSYNATRPLFCYTDCVSNGYTSHISSFYSGDKIGPEWDGGNTWNREHTWPNSKGDANGQGENDIMMLRPTSTKENGSRGNTAYGESSSYYDPNGLGQNVRGDCARIILYVYTRWGTANMWGSGGVMESKNVLLKWMEEDPVDTWEMGRNDAVQSITGVRNVYVDYPEFAWLLFGESAPTDMVTPSGIASGGTAVPDIPDTPVTPDEPDTPTTPTTEEEIINAAYELAEGEALPGSYTLTGEITHIKEYDSATTNICLTMSVRGIDFYCYWMRDNANGDNKNLVVGDTITVTGTIKNYDGTIEFDKPELSKVEKTGDTPVEPDEPDVPDEPDTPVTPPVTSGLKEGVAYTVSASNADGILYLTDSITSGRFDCSTSASNAVSVYVENVSGGQLLYMLNGTSKVYFVFADKAAGGSTTTSASSATVFEWNSNLNTLVVADDTNNRAFGVGKTSTHESFSAYDASNKDYNWGQFTAVGGEVGPSVPDTPIEPDEPSTPDVPVTPDVPGSSTTPDEPEAPTTSETPEENESECEHSFSKWIEVKTPDGESCMIRICMKCGHEEKQGGNGNASKGCGATIGCTFAGTTLLAAACVLFTKKRKMK